MHRLKRKYKNVTFCNIFNNLYVIIYVGRKQYEF